VAVVMSGLIALTVTPMLCAHGLKRHSSDRRPGVLSRMCENVFNAMATLYGRCLDVVLAHRYLTLTMTLLTALITVWLYMIVPKGFFPQQDTGLIIGVAEAAPDIGSKEMGHRIQALAQIAMTDPDVDNVYCWIGANPTLSQGRMMINLKPFNARHHRAQEIMSRLKPRFAHVEGIALYMQLRQDIQVGGRPSKTQYQYTLQGADSSDLGRWARKMQAGFMGTAELRDVTADIQADAPRVSLHIDRDTAARFGLTPQMIDDTLYDAFGQRQVATIFTQLNQYHVILESTPENQENTEALSHINLRSPITGQLVPLSQVTTIETTLAPITINHQNIFPAITISFNIAPGYALGDAVSAVSRVERAVGLPPQVTGNFQGAAQAFKDSMKSQPWLIVAAIIAVYIVLGILYESFVHPLTILSTLPSAGLGALLALLVTGEDLSVMGIIGILLLIGIVKKNAIMMVDVALVEQRQHGALPLAAIRTAALKRFRPIMMTTAAALLGALPLAISSGAGSELRRPLGITIIGGLLLSQVLTLLTTPVVYLALERLSSIWRRTDQLNVKEISPMVAARSPTTFESAK
jgi:multidrug efflux pump